ncbi:MAG: hypothetical protein IKS03_08195 [Ruminococcus sp.]|nr:hypothetical protein [Ruminococcus sp.]
MGLMKKVLYKLAGINEELVQIYESKGYCDEYIDKFKALHSKKMAPMDYLTLADIYISMKRYSDAEEMLSHVNIGFMTDDTIKGMYLLQRLNLYIGEGKGQEAFEVFAREQKFLDIFFSAPAYKRMGVAYYDAAAVTLAMNGQLEAAGRYYQLEKQSAEANNKAYLYPVLTNVHMLKAAGNDDMAEEAAAKAREEIMNFNSYSYPWQKEQFLDMLNDYMK